MNSLFLVALFGTAVVSFLWIRDMRIFYRTGLAGYRMAAYQGVLYTALALFGLMVTGSFESVNLIGIGLILLALYLQGKNTRERIWTDEPTWIRFFGRAPMRTERRENNGIDK